MAKAHDRLAEYNRRRDFDKTAEPRGTSTKPGTGQLVFAVQKHAATRLHFDLRLEWRGVLLSWAVTRGPSNAQKAKRLAVRTEDHPLSYAEFEGTIPKGSYGAGTVMLWDIGTWQPLTAVEMGLEKGTLKFEIFGTRMRGAWTLVRMKPKPKEKRENWLLIKERDQFLDDTDEEGMVREHITSVSTGRTMEEIAEGVKSRRKVKKLLAKKNRFTLPAPKFMKPQLATSADDAPEGDGWLHETKYDGYRCLASIGNDGIRLYTRTGLDWTERYVNLPRAFTELSCGNALVDGEVIAAPDSGTSAFSSLQRALESHLPVRFQAFDLLVLDGQKLTAMPLLERKERLRKLLKALPKGSPVAFAEHVTGNGPAVFEAVTMAGGEGTIAKRSNSSYRHQRTKSWLKIKAERREEFVIGGYSPSSKRGRPFASLLLGFYERGRLTYRGRVGSGFGEREFETLAPLIRENKRKSSPFEAVPAEIARTANWLEPRLVAEVSYAEMTTSGNIRHGVFIGLRDDKAPKSVMDSKSLKKPTGKVSGIAISSGDRVVFPRTGLTKLGVAEYYQAVGDRMIKHCGNRPMSLVRCPDGISSACFFQRHVGEGFPEQMKSTDIEEKDGDFAPYLYVTSPAGLVGAAQMGTIEFHNWGCKADAVEKPDRMVFDLDPDEAISFPDVKSAAADIRDFLASVRLECIPMVTGGKGIHIIVPLRRTVSWDTVKTFSHTVAAVLAERHPKRFTATMSKAKRKGRIFIDWLRNERGSTAIAPWSLRARENASVAFPLTWSELRFVGRADEMDISAVLKRLSDPDPLVSLSEQILDERAVSLLQQQIDQDKL